MVAYTAIYPGADNFLVPSYNPTGYQMSPGDFGTTLDPRTANQLSDANIKMNPGVKHVEITEVDPGVSESIPKQHRQEMKRLMKLTGVSPSVHIPVLEASGMGQDGWNEANRIGVEKQLAAAVLRSHDLDPKGNISVTTHSTAQIPEMKQTIKTKDGEETTALWIVDPRTGKYHVIKPEERYFPEKGKFTPEEKKEFKPEKELEKFNKDQWINQLSDINRQANYGEQTIREVERQFNINSEEEKQKINKILSSKIDIDRFKEPEKERIKQIQRGMHHGQIYLRDSYRNMKALFDMAYSNANEKDKKKLNQFAKWAAPQVQEGIEGDPKKREEFTEIIEKGLKTLSEIQPEMFVPLNNFVIDKSSQTFANVAESAYNEFGKTAPILNIENPPAGGGLSKAEDLKSLIKESRKKLTKNLIENNHLDKSEAKKISEKLIGATWDVGHINMLRKQGYEDKDIIKQTEIIAPFVKHVHLSDNFGYEHTELPMGMGNVPIKQIMQKLGKKGFEAKKIIEAGNWWQHFADKGGGNPFKPTIEGFNSQAYKTQAGPTWGQIPGLRAYYLGQGPINPPIHHSVYQAGFTPLPVELGGEMPGQERGRFAQGN